MKDPCDRHRLAWLATARIEHRLRWRVIASLAIWTGWLLLVIAACEVALLFYYRPTFESSFVGGYSYLGRPERPAPTWLTGEVIGATFGAALGIVGGLLMWAGGRLRHR